MESSHLIEKFTAKWQMWFIIVITAIVLAFALVNLSIGFEPPWGLTILVYLITAIFSQVLRGFSQEESIKELVNAAIGPLQDELERNYCIAKQHSGCILGTNAWVTATSSGIVLSFAKEQLRPLIECYSAIEFYNHDTKKGSISLNKEKRVMKAIANVLDVLGSRNLKDKDCTSILKKWVGNGSSSKVKKATSNITSEPKEIHFVPRTWYARKGDLCQKGKQLHWGKCYYTGVMTVHSEANETPLCKHIECGKRISEEIVWIDLKDPIPGLPTK